MEKIMKHSSTKIKKPRMTTRLKVLIVIMVLLGIYTGWDYWLRNYANRITVETAHYTITSTATPPQTMLVGKSAESLYSAYTAFFNDMINLNGNQPKLKMRLFRDKQEFSFHNKSSSWAEAFYKYPCCYAYYPEGSHNPCHWMIHEGTHQLNNEVARFKIQRWINEELASYYGTSKIKEGKLLPGQIDINTYPIWWLPGISLSGDILDDIRKGRIIPLRSLITGNGGPDFNEKFNLYYMHYWSLSHFLLHYNGGQYAEGYKKAIADGGSLESFEKRIGPVDIIQNEWYEYLRQRVLEVKTMQIEAKKSRNKRLVKA
jgi:hypothetical protein